LTVFSFSLNFPCTQSRRINLDTKQARVAPILLAKETMMVPLSRPKRAPPARVITAAPGRDNEVTRT